MANTNLTIWEQFRKVPETAKRRIQGGHLNGKTDINPVWRMKMLTEQFGPIGLGWNVTEKERWTNECAGETAAFVKVELRIKFNGEWSEPIEGTGGSKLCGKGRGEGINDEAWKMATTDAISVACKSLGMAADVYFEKDAYLGTKYETANPAPASRRQQTTAPAPAPANESIYVSGLTASQYWQMVRNYGDGKTAKNGGDLRQAWIENATPRPDEVEQFDCDVRDYLAAKADGGLAL